MQKKSLRRAAIAVASAGALAAGSFALVSAPASADNTAPTGDVLGVDNTDKIHGEYIVVLNSELSTMNTGAYDVDITAQWEFMNGFAAQMTYAQAQKIAADPNVKFVEQNAVVTIQDAGSQPNPPSWGLDRIDQADLPLDETYNYPNTASDVTAYILDTGVNLTHEDFAGRMVEGYDAVTPGGDADDCQGHGTHVAGTVAGTEYGVAKGASISPVRVLDCNGSGSYAGIIDGIEWATENASGPSVANMSLGGPSDASLNAAVDASSAAGLTHVVAAGNSGDNACNYSPAGADSAITVGSTTSTDARSSFSSLGECVDLFAPGSDITAPWIGSDTATNTISGTSMASPHVAGAAALFLQDNPDASPEDVRAHLTSTASEGKVGNPGTGSPNLLLFVG
ncbi:S8 family peptidase [Natronoglycomyces albus]|uniref:S8 family peptidase n=1 Tax=Natronoglycomyces albus TaxID=2811108 RepID=A0A895XPF9_9ACTN|nr:S8 family peptidase [Natronoglycomyces albus]QSB04975.1 S8 family peptidase [Natronoglycomyces albus]